MSRKNRDNRKPSESAGNSGQALTPPHPARPAAWLSWMRSPWIVVAILAIGMALRLWGVTERHYIDTDSTGHFVGGDMYRVTWEWWRSGAYKTMPLLEYKDQQEGAWVYINDTGKPLNILIRAFIIFLTGDRSIIAHSVLDIFFAVAAMGLMLRWCYRNLGSRIAVLAGCLWLVGGQQFQDVGRCYDYSPMLFFATVGWLRFMERKPDNLYRSTFVAGLALGAGFTYHYNFFDYLPLCAVFILLFRNPAGWRGKLLEIVAFAAGFGVFPLLVVGWYRGMTWMTGTTWDWWLNYCLFEGANTFSQGMQLHPKFFIPAWFVWQYLNGLSFMLLLLAGIVVVALLHIRRYGWRWSICDDPLFIVTGVASYGLLIWGLYHFKCPKVHMPEIATWPVLAAIAVHYITRWITKGRWLNTVQIILVAGVMLEQWQHTAPLIKMGAGIRKAMVVMSNEGKTATGQTDLTSWPCTTRIKHLRKSALVMDQWEYLDDYLTANGYDYFYVDYALSLSMTVTYPGAGHPLMIGMYDRLLAKAAPAWRFEYGAPVYARLESGRTEWLQQWQTPEAWRKHNRQTTPYDRLVERVPYFDVFRCSDVIQAFHESRVNLLAQLLVIQQRDPNQYRQIVPRFHNWIQYNATNQVVMKEAQQAAAGMVKAPGR